MRIRKVQLPSTGILRRVCFALEESGRCPAEEFFGQLKASSHKQDRSSLARLHRYLEWLDEGRRLGPEKFKHVKDKLWEIRLSGKPIRMLCFVQANWIVITHGFLKKQDKIPAAEIERAERIRRESLEGENDHE